MGPRPARRVSAPPRATTGSVPGPFCFPAFFHPSAVQDSSAAELVAGGLTWAFGVDHERGSAAEAVREIRPIALAHRLAGHLNAALSAKQLYPPVPESPPTPLGFWPADRDPDGKQVLADMPCTPSTIDLGSLFV